MLCNNRDDQLDNVVTKLFNRGGTDPRNLLQLAGGLWNRINDAVDRCIAQNTVCRNCKRGGVFLTPAFQSVLQLEFQFVRCRWRCRILTRFGFIESRTRFFMHIRGFEILGRCRQSFDQRELHPQCVVNGLFGMHHQTAEITQIHRGSAVVHFALDE